MKHRELNRSNCTKPGYNPPNPPKSKEGGGYPHKQPFKKPSK